jgi:FkbH-like protein
MPVEMRSAAAAPALRELVSQGRFDEAWSSLVPELVTGAPGTLRAARNVVRAGAAAGWSPPVAREIRLAVLCTYEAAELREQVRLACLALRIDARVYDAPYGQLEQELLTGDTPLSAFDPTHVVIAPTTADLALPELAEDAEAVLADAEARWPALWRLVRDRLGARVVQHGFVVPDETPLGHLSMRMPASRIELVRELNRRLARAAAETGTLLVDTERIASRIGKRTWTDPRLWYGARRPYGGEALDALALETAAVLAADLGLGARCLVVDLDNTLWGGVVGEEGPLGIAVGDGPDGEAFADFQAYVAALGRRGVILAVASKNDPEAAREPFERNPAMRLAASDFAAFVADWRPKSQQLAEVAATIGIGLDAIVFADDNPAECAEVAAALPEVTTICLDVAPSERIRRLAACARFELSSLSRDDLERQRSYAARAEAARLREGTGSIEDFWRSLAMRARVAPVTDATLERAASLIQKTNQFNLTLDRHSREELERLVHDPGAICMTLELEDRFARHGLIGLGIVVRSDDEPAVGLIDTLLMSCRVIGRTAERHLLSHLGRAALANGLTRLRGTYVPGPRNALVAELYPKLGFAAAGEHVWEWDLGAAGPPASEFIDDEEQT